MLKIFFILFLVDLYSPNSIRLNVTVKNIQVGKGSIVISIYDKDSDFFKKAISSRIIKANNETLNFDFDVREGTYAIAVYQDLNGNKVLDRGWFSVPKEPYGLSNNFRPTFSAPKFKDCSLKIDKNTTVTITLK